MIRNWVKTDEGRYELLIDGSKAGTLAKLPNTSDSRAMIKLAEREYMIRRTGFWKNNIEVIDQNRTLVARVFYEKWYANTWIIEYNTHVYKLVVRNNPMAEWAVLEGDTVLLSYGLTHQDGKTGTKITASPALTNFLFDALLWYLFAPIAAENTADNEVFLTLLA
ncbi:hypothetical protein ACO2Q8_08570 [Larkinella sp. VNQ87]|uniref:hypothetical protein n=1 Tax=Larkinella sp. VNQ87 TaxID=3400921 RepID=UPI003BFBC4A4